MVHPAGEQLLTPLKGTARPLLVQTEVSFKVTDVVPSPSVATVVVNEPPNAASVGRLVTVGVAHRAVGHISRVREAVRAAYDLAGYGSSAVVAEQARTELMGSGVRPRRQQQSGFLALTASERRVSELATGGLTNTQIAQRLFVTRSRWRSTWSTPTTSSASPLGTTSSPYCTGRKTGDPVSRLPPAARRFVHDIASSPQDRRITFGDVAVIAGGVLDLTLLAQALQAGLGELASADLGSWMCW